MGGGAAGHERRADRRAAITGSRKDLQSFVEEPHAAIDGLEQGEIVNLTDRRADASAQASSSCSLLGPDGIARVGRADATPGAAQSDRAASVAASGHAGPSRRARRATSSCAACTARSQRRPIADPPIFAELLLTPGVGARTVRRWRWWPKSCTARPIASPIPARFSLAHGGKDGHPSRCR